LVKELEKQMRAAAEGLEFEKAAGLRDQIFELRQALADMEDLPPWQRARVLSGDR
jgi:excinuclease ABC subunit B